MDHPFLQCETLRRQGHAVLDFPLFSLGLRPLPPWRGKVGMGGRSTAWALHQPSPPPSPSPVSGGGKRLSSTEPENCMTLLRRRAELDEQITDFAHRALATRQMGNVDGTGTVGWHRISNGAGATHRMQGWEIVHIVTDIGYMREG